MNEVIKVVAIVWAMAGGLGGLTCLLLAVSDDSSTRGRWTMYKAAAFFLLLPIALPAMLPVWLTRAALWIVADVARTRDQVRALDERHAPRKP